MRPRNPPVYYSRVYATPFKAARCARNRLLIADGSGPAGSLIAVGLVGWKTGLGDGLGLLRHHAAAVGLG